MRLFDWFGGRRGPLDHAAKYLRRQKVRIVDSTDSLRARGIDFVGLEGQVVLFVAVRTRGGTTASASPSESEISAAARAWLADHGEFGEWEARIDVLRLDWYGARKGAPTIRYFSDAVSLERCSVSPS